MVPSRQNQSDAALPERRSTAADLDRDGFRPVALPALVAAVQAAALVKPIALKPASPAISERFLHEDAPLV